MGNCQLGYVSSVPASRMRSQMSRARSLGIRSAVPRPHRILSRNCVEQPKRERWPPGKNYTRRSLLWRFPFSIIYSEQESTVTISGLWATRASGRSIGTVGSKAFSLPLCTASLEKFGLS
jgi:hypothetical protein